MIAKLTDYFCSIVNTFLQTGQVMPNKQALYEYVSQAFSEPFEPSVFERLYDAYHQAAQPTTFFNERVSCVNAQFEQCYTLLRSTFDSIELEPRHRYVELYKTQNSNPLPHIQVMLGRHWQVSGPQAYDIEGNLVRFGYNTLLTTESIAGVISGTYLRLASSGRDKESIGAIGHLAIRERFRNGQGHGTILLEAFERECQAIANERGEKLQLIVLEAQPSARRFLYHRGYRWPVDIPYKQPPFEFDPETGIHRYDEVAETLMVKIPYAPNAPGVDQSLLKDAIREVYEAWYLPMVANLPPRAALQARNYVYEKVFGDFVASLSSSGNVIPMGKPLGVDDE
jgi:ribosomal protein S18 acetylase RimI-like enzyme